jgi:hypothetical protein
MRDPTFFLQAVSMLVAALLAPSSTTYPDDERLAIESAELVAALLDHGAVPDDYMTPENLAAISQMLYFEHQRLDETPVKGSSEGERQIRFQQRQKQEQMATKPELKAHVQAPRSIKTIRADNQQALQALQDISEPVRYAALSATAERIVALGNKVTGFHKTEVLGIAIRELQRAIEFANRYGVPARGIETVEQQKIDGLIDDETAARICPYPASVSLSLVRAILVADQIEEDPSAPSDSEPTASLEHS